MIAGNPDQAAHFTGSFRQCFGKAALPSLQPEGETEVLLVPLDGPTDGAEHSDEPITGASMWR